MMLQHVRPSILPPNATPLEAGADYALGRLGETPVPLGSLWSIADCPEALLPWLAWALGVEEWGHDWPLEVKRATIAAAYDVHRLRGTPAAVKRLLDGIGAVYDYSEPSALNFRVEIYNSESLVIDDVRGLSAAIERVKRLAARGVVTVAAGLTGKALFAAGLGARTVVELGLPAEGGA